MSTSLCRFAYTNHFILRPCGNIGSNNSGAVAPIACRLVVYCCRDADGIIQRKVAAWIKKDPIIAASLIRLHFHDCAVRRFCPGSHTIGRNTCEPVQERLHSFKGTGRPDPSMDLKYLNDLRGKCRKSYNYVDFDVTTPRTFDNTYYKNLQKKLGLLTTYQLLNSDPRTTPFVAAFASEPTIFESHFADSMAKLGRVNVLTRKNQGEIRVNCNLLELKFMFVSTKWIEALRKRCNLLELKFMS